MSFEMIKKFSLLECVKPVDHAGDFSEAPKTMSHHFTLLRTGSVPQSGWWWHKVREPLGRFWYSALATASGKRWVISISSSEKVYIITKELQTYQLPHQDLWYCPLPKSEPGPLDPDHQRTYECKHFRNAVWLEGYERCAIHLCQMSEWLQLGHKPWLRKSDFTPLSFYMWRSVCARHTRSCEDESLNPRSPLFRKNFVSLQMPVM